MIKNIRPTSVLKSLAISMSLAAAVLATSCTSTLSHNINPEGQVETSDLVFPEMDKAWEKEGVFPNSENLSKVRAGANKDDLYQLIGRPHFSERQHAKEWDYIFKFYQDDGSIEKCQFKVIFDKDNIAQQFYWQPNDCAKYAQVENASSGVVATPIVNEQINLAADALFDFDQWQISNIKPNGKQSLDELAAVLRKYQDQGNSRVVITGHTDRLGDDAYNLQLSERRANTVRSYLIQQGVKAATISATGAGEAKPVALCTESANSQALINCLQPNRRVEVMVSVYAQQQ